MADRFTRGIDDIRHKGMRIGTLWTNSEIDGDVTLSPYFDALDGIAKIDLLNDVIGLLDCERRHLIKEVWGEE